MNTTRNAARITASVFGVLSGLGGLVHGVGEVLQGNVAPDGIGIYSWAQGPIATNMGGEPGITIIPNLLLTGVLAIIVSLMTIVWAAVFIQRKNGDRTLSLLAIAMLLFGGGVGPPVIGLLAGIVGRGINGPLTWWSKLLPDNLRHILAAVWPWFFGLAALNGVLLVIGSLLLIYLFDFNNPDFFVNSFFFAALSLLILVPLSRAYDLEKEASAG